MDKEIEQIINSIKETFEGKPWFGVSLLEKLNSINYKLVNERVNGSNSIGKLVAHLIQWRIFVIEKLKGNQAFDIEMNSELDWPEITINSEEEWIVLLDKLKSTQHQIIDLMSTTNDSFLDEQVTGKGYDNRTYMDGIIHHDIYHFGQICLIEKQIERRNGLNS